MWSCCREFKRVDDPRRHAVFGCFLRSQQARFTRTALSVPNRGGLSPFRRDGGIPVCRKRRASRQGLRVQSARKPTRSRIEIAATAVLAASVPGSSRKPQLGCSANPLPCARQPPIGDKASSVRVEAICAAVPKEGHRVRHGSFMAGRPLISNQSPASHGSRSSHVPHVAQRNQTFPSSRQEFLAISTLSRLLPSAK